MLPGQLSQKWSLLRHDQKRRPPGRVRPGPGSWLPWVLQRIPEKTQQPHGETKSFNILHDIEYQKLNAFNFTYLNKTTRRQLLGVDDQLRSIPKGQCETKENDAPEVSLENANDRALFNTPALSFCKVSVIPVQIPHFHFISNRGGMSHHQLQSRTTSCDVRKWRNTVPVSFFFLAAKCCYRSDGRQDLVSHCPGLCIGRELSSC